MWHKKPVLIGDLPGARPHAIHLLQSYFGASMVLSEALWSQVDLGPIPAQAFPTVRLGGNHLPFDTWYSPL